MPSEALPKTSLGCRPAPPPPSSRQGPQPCSRLRCFITSWSFLGRAFGVISRFLGGGDGEQQACLTPPLQQWSCWYRSETLQHSSAVCTDEADKLRDFSRGEFREPWLDAEGTASEPQGGESAIGPTAVHTPDRGRAVLCSRRCPRKKHRAAAIHMGKRTCDLRTGGSHTFTGLDRLWSARSN